MFDRLRQRLRRETDTSRGAPFDLPDLHSPRRVPASATVGVLVYTGVTTAEADEPVRRLANGLDADVVHIGATATSVVGIEPVRTVYVDFGFLDAPPVDVLVIPGGLGWQRIAEDEVAMSWLVKAAENATGIFAISTGTLILASAGRLAGESATGHWLARDALAALGADVSTERTAHTHDSRIVTASGATAALSVCDSLAARLRWGP